MAGEDIDLTSDLGTLIEDGPTKPCIEMSLNSCANAFSSFIGEDKGVGEENCEESQKSEQEVNRPTKSAESHVAPSCDNDDDRNIPEWQQPKINKTSINKREPVI